MKGCVMGVNGHDLIIFDCDGTLVDSEYLNNKVLSDLFHERGLTKYTPERCIFDFMGASWGKINHILKERHGFELSREEIDSYVRRVAVERKTVDISIEGASDFVASCKEHYMIAVGSNGERFSVIDSLKRTRLIDFFSEAHVFTASQVSYGKPAPDLFLYAANKMGVEASKCLVIEDSPTGVKAGVAAGMNVWGFTGVAHDKEKAEKLLLDAGASRVYDNFIHMRQVLKL